LSSAPPCLPHTLLVGAHQTPGVTLAAYGMLVCCGSNVPMDNAPPCARAQYTYNTHTHTWRCRTYKGSTKHKPEVLAVGASSAGLRSGLLIWLHPCATNMYWASTHGERQHTVPPYRKHTSHTPHQKQQGPWLSTHSPQRDAEHSSSPPPPTCHGAHEICPPHTLPALSVTPPVTLYCPLKQG
jgi:hypothetical protein